MVTRAMLEDDPEMTKTEQWLIDAIVLLSDFRNNVRGHLRPGDERPISVKHLDYITGFIDAYPGYLSLRGQSAHLPDQK